jgi:uncharacterized cupin superfamily protein
MVEEARFKETESGLEPVSEGWFIVNVADTTWWRSDVFGASCPFEGNDDERRRKTNEANARFKEYGINIHVVWPGQPNCMYHREGAQEDFLVLSGECLLLVEGEERPLKAWDFVHFPEWTEHVIVGAGDDPCAILMVGSRADERVTYPVSELAQKHGAGVEQETGQPAEAYARFPSWRRERVEEQGLPWS